MATITIDDEDLVRRLHEHAEHEGKTPEEIVVEAIFEKAIQANLLPTAGEHGEYWSEVERRIRARNPDESPHADIKAPETSLPE